VRHLSLELKGSDSLQWVEMRASHAAAFVIGLLVAASLFAGENWPAWRGSSGQGQSDDKDLPLTWGGKNNENVLWKVALPGADGKARLDHNQSSPIVWRDRVFLIMVYWPADVPQKDAPEHHVACYQTSDGKKLWDTVVPPGPWLLGGPGNDKQDFRGGYSAPTPATDGERVYALFGSSMLAALDFNGKIVWRKEITPYAWDVAIGTSPFLYQDSVLVLTDGTKGPISRLSAFDKKTGDIKWEEKRPKSSFSHSAPLLIDVKGKPQLILSSSNAIQGVDPANGKIIWWCNNPGDVTTPVYGNGVVYCDSARGGPGVAVDPTGEGDVTKTHRKWETAKIPEGFYCSPVIVGEYLYRPHAPGLLRCLKMASGDMVYDERLPAGIPNHVSPIATADGRIYLASAGKSVVIAAGPEFKILATNDLGDSSPASPAVTAGRLYLKGAKNLYCIGKK
jgi:outer membrane protein assembly factor BamB